MLQYLDPASSDTQGLVLTPTRELCIQVTQALRAYAEHLPVEVIAVFGGQSVQTQQSRLRAGAHVVVATVGRTLDLISRGSLDLTASAVHRARRGRRDARPGLHRRGRAHPADLSLGQADRAVLGHHPAADRAARRPLHVRPGHDQGDAEADHRRRDRAGLCGGAGEGQGRPPGGDPPGRGSRAGHHLLPHEDRHRAARQDASGPRPPGQGAARRPEPGPARRRHARLQGPQASVAGCDGRGRPRARHRARHPRDQLRRSGHDRGVHPPGGPHGSSRPHGARDHLRDAQAAARRSRESSARPGPGSASGSRRRSGSSTPRVPGAANTVATKARSGPRGQTPGTPP